ncbi:hypothetical protein [Paenibacillus guangzhouensis]|uniref:hypothetical protein n=1 Tax=Paenibacillus guangzhouensis TaxID=1473112 RepID=UPI0012673F8F|nr:hypothetical protein [Paenibacillus guangzhouensis]
MWSEISKLIGANPIMTLVLTIFGTTTIWLYKEFKEMINQNNRTQLASVNEKIKIYSQLQASISAVIHGGDAKFGLMQKLGESSPYLSENVRRIARDFYYQADIAYLTSMLTFIDVDLGKLEQEKTKYSKYDKSTDISDFVLKLYAPLKPIAFIWVSILVFLLTYDRLLKQQFWYDQVYVIFITGSTALSAIIVFVLFSLKLEGALPKQGAYRWGINLLIVVMPMLSLVHNALSIMSLIIQILLIMILLHMKKRKKNIILMID